MTRILDRYIFKEILSPFLLGVLLLTFLILLNQLLILTEWVSDKGISLITVAELFVKLLPSFFLVTIPMTTAFSTILAFNRLSLDNEVVALRAAGIGISRILWPVFIFAIMVAILTLLMGNLSSHFGTSSFKGTAIKMLKEKIGVGLEAARFTEIFPGLMIYTESIADATKMGRVFIYDGRSPQGPPHIVVAKKGLLLNNGDTVGLELQDGAIYTHNNLIDQTISFGSYTLKINPIKKGETILPKNNDPHKTAVNIASQRKYSLSYAAFLFCFLGVPLGLLSGKGGRLWPFVIGIAMILSYYSLYNVGDDVFPPHGMFPEMAAWLPNLVLTPITICMFIFCKNKNKF